MNKQIIFYLLFIANTTIHGMETIFHDKNDSQILSCLTKHLYHAEIHYGYHKYDCYDLGESINSLSRANTFFHAYFSREKTGQIIVTCIAHHTKDSDLATSFYLHRYKNVFKTIQNNIERLFTITANQHEQFTKEDLSDPWYVNATQGFGHRDITLLSEACKEGQIQKIKDIINAKADVKNNHLLIHILNREKRARSKNNIDQKKLLIIAHLLLENGADPNFQHSRFLPLSEAITYNEKEYAQLLLWYNANPYKTNYVTKQGGISNAFSLTRADWFKPMFDEKQQIIFNCWLFKHHNLEKATLLPEIIKIIRYKVWEVCKQIKMIDEVATQKNIQENK